MNWLQRDQRRRWPWVCGRFMAGFLFFCLAGTITSARETPNVILIFSDDQAPDTIGAHGNPVLTPNLDRLARDGVSFLNAYNSGSWHGAVCIASRTMLVTGKQLWRAHKADRRLGAMAAERQLWPQRMKDAGYETYMTGKWHIKIDPEEIFDEVVHARPGMPPDVEAGYQRPVWGEQDPWSPYARQFGGFWEGGKHWSEALADDAEAFIQRASERDAPFFMYLAFNAPHDPRQSPKRFVDLYPHTEVVLPSNFLPEYPLKQEIGCFEVLDRNGGLKLQRDEKIAPWPRTEYAVRVHRSEYYASVTHMDEQIGRIEDSLRRTGEWKNTVIIFMSDHGLAIGGHGLMGKQNMYEHSVRAPFIIAGPGLPRGEIREHPIYIQDAMATALDLAGVDPADTDFHSVFPVARDSAHPGHYAAIYGAYMNDLQRMVRVGDYKLIVYPKAGKVRLFNLRKDPGEILDLSGNPAQWPRIERMFLQLLDLQREYDDPLDLSPFFSSLVSG